MTSCQLVVVRGKSGVVAHLDSHTGFAELVEVLRSSVGDKDKAEFSFVLTSSAQAKPISLTSDSFPLLRLSGEAVVYVDYRTQPAPAKALQPFTKYSVVDDEGGRVRVLIPLPGNAELRKEDVEACFEPRNFEVRAHNLGGVDYIFRVGKTHHKLDPGKCSAEVRKGKIVVRLCHQNPEEAFYSLYKVKMIGEVPED